MLLIMGPAGSGKTEQAQKLVEDMDLVWISTGHLLREAMNRPDMKAKMDKGELVDDKHVEDILADAINKVSDPKRIILDGFPRSVEQSKWLFQFLKDEGITISCVVNIELPLSEAKKRLNKRGRGDDTENAIEQRFKEYQAVTLPMLEYYEEHNLDICTVDGVGDRDKVHQRIKSAIREHSDIYKS